MNFLIEPFEADEEHSPPSHTLCPSCGTLFPYRSSKTFCSPNCRKAHSKRAARQVRPANATSSPYKARHQYRPIKERETKTVYLSDFKAGPIVRAIGKELRSAVDCAMGMKWISDHRLLQRAREALALPTFQN